MPDEGPFQRGSSWLDSLLYDDGQGALGNWPDEHQPMGWGRLPLIGWLFRTPGKAVSLGSVRYW